MAHTFASPAASACRSSGWCSVPFFRARGGREGEEEEAMRKRKEKKKTRG